MTRQAEIDDPRRKLRIDFVNRLIQLTKLRGDQRKEAMRLLYNDLHGFDQPQAFGTARSSDQGIWDLESATEIINGMPNLSPDTKMKVTTIELELVQRSEEDNRLTGLGTMPSDE